MSKPAFDDLDPGQFWKSFVHIARLVIVDPKLFFDYMRQGGGLKNPTIFLLICTLFHSVVISFFVKNQTLIIAYLASGIATPFLMALIVKLALKNLFQVAGTYESAFRINAYASAIALLSWIPAIGFFIELYRLYIISYGLSRIFHISIIKCLATVLIAIIAIAVIFIPIAGILGLEAGLISAN